MWLRPALLVLALAASGPAGADVPDRGERIARLSYIEGQVTFQGAGEASPSALPDRPLVPGDRVATGPDGRAELAFGTAVARLDQDTELSLVTLDAATVRMDLTAGTASLHLRELLEDETFEIATPTTTLALRQPGEYRVDVGAGGETEFAVRTGAAEAEAADAFDDWVLEREQLLAKAEPLPDEPPDGYYEDEALDPYGEWSEEPGYGRVWMPSYAYGGYDPFRYGRWERVGFGWSWYDPMLWGAYTFHRGRWTYLDHRNRWCWVPERRHHRRHVEEDTRPYRRPRDEDRRDSNRRDDDERPRVASSTNLPLRLDVDRRPAIGRAIETGKPARGAAPVPRANRDPSPAPQNAPTLRPSVPATQGSVTTKLRPARSAEKKGETATQPTTRAKGTFARPQEL